MKKADVVSAMNGANNEDYITPYTLRMATLNKYFPVGAIYISSKNENPGKYLGGTWELIDKEFKSDKLSGLSYFKANSTNATTTTVYVTRSGHTLAVRLGLENKVAFGDSTLSLGVLNFEALGISRLHFTSLYIPLFSDAGNGLVFGYFDWETGEYFTADVIPKEGTTIEANKQFYASFDLTIPYDYMLDEACSKFYWKRVA